MAATNTSNPTDSSKKLKLDDGQTRDPYKQALIDHQVELVDNLNCEDGLYDYLIRDKVVEPRTKNRLMNGVNKEEKAVKLLDHLLTRPQADIEYFIDALIATNQDHLASFFPCQVSEDEEKPWPLSRAAYDLGPIEIHIQQQTKHINKELGEIRKLASATASSRCKGSIRLMNVEWDGSTNQQLVKWKKTASDKLQCLVGEDKPELLFDFCKNGADSEHIYLHVKPATMPLLVPPTIYQSFNCESTDKEDLINNMIDLLDEAEYRCYMLNKEGKPKDVLKADFKAKMEKLKAQIRGNRIHDRLNPRDLEEYTKIKIPKQDCVLYTMYGVEDMIKAHEGLQTWPATYEEMLQLNKNTRKRQKVDMLISTLKERYKDSDGLLFISPCLLQHLVQVMDQSPVDIICDILVLTMTDMPLLLTLGWEKSTELQEYSEHAQQYLDQIISSGSECAFCIQHTLITDSTLKTENWLDMLVKTAYENKKYPSQYVNMNKKKLISILCSLVAQVATLVPDNVRTTMYMKDMANVAIMNFMTLEQLTALEECKNTTKGHIVLKGNPGTGHMVVAMEYIKWLRRKDAKKEEILFVTYSAKLLQQIESMKLPWCHENKNEHLCEVITISYLVSLGSILPDKYKDVKWWILDNVQNFEFIKKRNKSYDEQRASSNFGFQYDQRYYSFNAFPGSAFDALQENPVTLLSTHMGGSENKSRQSKKWAKLGSSQCPVIAYETSKKLGHDHWLCNFQVLYSQSCSNQVVMLIDQTQSVVEDPTDEIRKIESALMDVKMKELRQVIRSSGEITKFIYTKLVPEGQDIRCQPDCVKQIMAHNYEGKTPRARPGCQVTVASLGDLVDAQKDAFGNALTDDDWEIIIDTSAVTKGSTHMGYVPSDGKEIYETTEHANLVPPTCSFLQDYIGLEKPVVIAILGYDAPWRHKVALASRARVHLYWIELKEPLSTTKLTQLLGKEKRITFVTQQKP